MVIGCARLLRGSVKDGRVVAENRFPNDNRVTSEPLTAACYGRNGSEGSHHDNHRAVLSVTLHKG